MSFAGAAPRRSRAFSPEWDREQRHNPSFPTTTKKRGRAMVLGMSLSTFTLIHVLISLVAILAGLVVLYGALVSKRFPRWTTWFLGLTTLTCVTGYFFPFTKILPSHITGVICLAVLAVAYYALYARKLAGPWRWIYVVSAGTALYLNVFVGVVQSFLKIKPLAAIAPTQQDPPFIVAQVVVLVIFIVLGVVAAKKFHPA
jgi:hypothetical protein